MTRQDIDSLVPGRPFTRRGVVQREAEDGRARCLAGFKAHDVA